MLRFCWKPQIFKARQGYSNQTRSQDKIPYFLKFRIFKKTMASLLKYMRDKKASKSSQQVSVPKKEPPLMSSNRAIRQMPRSFAYINSLRLYNLVHISKRILRRKEIAEAILKKHSGTIQEKLARRLKRERARSIGGLWKAGDFKLVHDKVPKRYGKKLKSIQMLSIVDEECCDR